MYDTVMLKEELGNFFCFSTVFCLQKNEFFVGQVKHLIFLDLKGPCQVQQFFYMLKKSVI